MADEVEGDVVGEVIPTAGPIDRSRINRKQKGGSPDKIADETYEGSELWDWATRLYHMRDAFHHQTQNITTICFEG